jgi:hypothetical protein
MSSCCTYNLSVPQDSWESNGPDGWPGVDGSLIFLIHSKDDQHNRLNQSEVNSPLLKEARFFLQYSLNQTLTSCND